MSLASLFKTGLRPTLRVGRHQTVFQSKRAMIHTSPFLRQEENSDAEEKQDYLRLLDVSVVGSNSLPKPGTVFIENSQFEVGTKMPLNIFKDGEDPEVLADDQYPEWLWGCLIPDETLQDLEARKHTLKWDNGGKRYWKLVRRQKIKEENASASQFGG